jgi:type III pantothenate kinase
VKLLLDVGNTRIKWSTLEGAGLGEGGEFAHRELDLAPLLERQWSGLDRPGRVLVSSVAAPARRRELERWLADRWGTPVRFAASQAHQLGVQNGYRDPARLGVDRWVALLAARSRFDGPVCVVDFGSALTIDGLARDGMHAGGLIVPGLRTMHRSLSGGDISLDAGEAPHAPAEVALGRDTAEAVGYGIQQCLALFVDGVCERMTRTFGETPARIVTGGDAEQMLPQLEGRYEHMPYLVLEGLALIALEDREESA